VLDDIGAVLIPPDADTDRQVKDRASDGRHATHTQSRVTTDSLFLVSPPRHCLHTQFISADVRAPSDLPPFLRVRFRLGDCATSRRGGEARSAVAMRARRAQ
jgi:hypothetical protein